MTPPLTLPEAAALVAVVAGGAWLFVLVLLGIRAVRVARYRRARARRSRYPRLRAGRPRPVVISPSYQEFMDSLEER